MNFVELGPIAPFSWVILGVSILVLFLAGMLLLKSSDSVFATLLSLTMTIGGAIGAGFSLESMTSVPLSDQRTEVGEQIEESYGLELSSEELKELDYPAAEPEGDFEVFGSIFRDQRTEDGFERTEIFLIWRDGEMALAGSPDGETFTELQR